jgi:cell shape-determining protein MreC
MHFPDQPDSIRLLLTAAIGALGLVIVLVAFLVALLSFRNSSDPGQIIPAVLGPVVSVVGTLVGYIAGQAAGSAGKEKAEARATAAQSQMQAVLDVSPPDTLTEAKAKHGDVFAV